MIAATPTNRPIPTPSTNVDQSMPAGRFGRGVLAGGAVSSAVCSRKAVSPEVSAEECRKLWRSHAARSWLKGEKRDAG